MLFLFLCLCTTATKIDCKNETGMLITYRIYEYDTYHAYSEDELKTVISNLMAMVAEFMNTISKNCLITMSMIDQESKGGNNLMIVYYSDEMDGQYIISGTNSMVYPAFITYLLFYV